MVVIFESATVGRKGTYLRGKLVTDEQPVLDLDGANHVFGHAHHHLLLLEVLRMHHGLLLALQMLLVGHVDLGLLRHLRLLRFLVLDQGRK